MLHANDVKTRDARDDDSGASWPERVIEVLRRIFVPEPQPVPVPVVVRPSGPILRRG
jgi:hypothetical protein